MCRRPFGSSQLPEGWVVSHRLERNLGVQQDAMRLPFRWSFKASRNVLRFELLESAVAIAVLIL